MQRQRCIRLRLVEPVVFQGEVYGPSWWAGGEQAQLQEVFDGARVGGDGVVLGHAYLVGHACFLACCGTACVLSQ